MSSADVQAFAADDSTYAYQEALARGLSNEAAIKAAVEARGTPTPVEPLNPTELAPGAMKVAAWLRGATAQKAALVANAQGRVLLPTDLQVDVLNYARTYGTVRSLVDPVPTGRIAARTVLLGDATVGWGRLETGASLVDANVAPGTPLDIEAHDLNALVQVGVNLLADTQGEDLRRGLVAVFGAAVADAEDAAFATGNGTDRPKGIAHADNITRVPSAQKLTAASPVTAANLRALPWLLPARYRRRAVWLLSSDAATAVAGLVDTGSGPVWPNPGNPIAAQGGGLMGWDAYELPGLPAMTGTNAPSIVFGDIGSAYRIEQRRNMSLQRLVQRWAELGLVGTILRHRVGGDVVRPGALALYLL